MTEFLEGDVGWGFDFGHRRSDILYPSERVWLKRKAMAIASLKAQAVVRTHLDSDMKPFAPHAACIMHQAKELCWIRNHNSHT
jgi:hypothetical protein